MKSETEIIYKRAISPVKHSKAEIHFSYISPIKQDAPNFFASSTFSSKIHSSPSQKLSYLTPTT